MDEGCVAGGAAGGVDVLRQPIERNRQTTTREARIFMGLSYQTQLSDFCANLCKGQLAESAAGKQRLVGDGGESKRRRRKIVEVFSRFEADFGEDETEQIAEK